MKIHRSYLPILDGILEKDWLKSLSHITGGGIIENTHRVLEKNQDIDIDWDSWNWPTIFKMIQDDGDIDTKDMIQPFNLGIGMILIIDENSLPALDAHLKSINEEYVVMGKVIGK